MRRRVARLLSHVSLYLALGLVVSMSSLVLFAALAENVMTNAPLVAFDMALANALHESVSVYQAQVFAFVSLFGSQVIFVLAVALSGYYIARRRWLSLAVWLITLGGGQVLNWLLKAFYARPRPAFAAQFVQEINTSFPSGHAMLSLIAYGMVAYLVVRIVPDRRLRILAVFDAVLLTVLISISRLYLGVHYFSDVVAGMAAGLVWLSACLTALEYLRRRRAPGEAAGVEVAEEAG